jgi:molybdopterin-synthase adenylyltransferase
MALDRYARQLALPEIGVHGQQKLAESSVLLLGAGALGTHQAELLARAGVGRLRIADRDFVQLDNLHRQSLFDEADAEARWPKAEAARRRLAEINRDVTAEALVVDVTARNVERLLDGVEVVLDATDNAETRYLVNDACIKHAVPWVYGGAVGTTGAVMLVRPGAGPCLRCVFPDAPAPGTLLTCEVRGVLNTVPALVAALQVTEAIRLLVGDAPRATYLTSVEPWEMSFRRVSVERVPDCRCCAERRFDFLEARETSSATSLCGRNAVQITPATPASLDLDALAERLGCSGDVTSNGLLLTLGVGDQELVVFPDGRAIVRGTNDLALARTMYARYLGL